MGGFNPREAADLKITIDEIQKIINTPQGIKDMRKLEKASDLLENVLQELKGTGPTNRK